MFQMFQAGTSLLRQKFRRRVSEQEKKKKKKTFQDLFIVPVLDGSSIKTVAHCQLVLVLIVENV